MKVFRSCDNRKIDEIAFAETIEDEKLKTEKKKSASPSISSIKTCIRTHSHTRASIHDTSNTIDPRIFEILLLRHMTDSFYTDIKFLTLRKLFASVFHTNTSLRHSHHRWRKIAQFYLEIIGFVSNDISPCSISRNLLLKITEK